MFIKLIYLCVLSIIGASLIAPSHASNSYHSLEEIREAAKQLVTNDVSEQKGYRTEIKVGHLDSRLRLKQCDQPLSAHRLQNGRHSGNTTVSVRCNGVKPWTIHVPVSVKSYAEVVVANQPLARQTPVKATDVRMEEREISSLKSGYFRHIEDVVGRHPKRTLVSGSILNPYDIEANKIIRRGNKVVIVAEVSGVAVRMRGKALKDAGQGEVLTVENLSSRRKIEVIAVSPGIVKVPM